MAANKPGKEAILAAFFDDGTYSPLFTDGAVSAAYGCANGQNAYVVFEDGSPVGVQDIEKNIRVLEMAAETGAPVVTFYDSTGAKLEGGLALLNANARLTAEIARVSGVVPQIAVVTGTCAGTNAINAASADVCVMAEDAELFLNAPFNAEDKVANAGSAEFAAKAGVAAVTAAETGHLVLSTLHTIGAAQTIDRIIDVCPAGAQNQIRGQLAAVLRGVITQQLLPLAGGKGRCAATEILVGTDAVANLIREGKCYQIPSILQSGAALGMHSLNADLARLVSMGRITREAAERCATDKSDLQNYL